VDQPNRRWLRQFVSFAAVYHSSDRIDSLDALDGTSIGTAAAIVPWSISGIPYLGWVAEFALREVDRGLMEGVRAMGDGNGTFVREVLAPDASPLPLRDDLAIDRVMSSS
jgi:ABC-type phosphate transport system permease subunit